jgi:hypothetical protein
MLKEALSGNLEKEAFIGAALKGVAGLATKFGGKFGKNVGKQTLGLKRKLNPLDKKLNSGLATAKDWYKGTAAYKKFGMKPLYGGGIAAAYGLGRMTAGGSNEPKNPNRLG